MKPSILIFVFLLLFCFVTFAQETTFKVVAVRGNVSTNNQKIAQKAEIKLSQTITVADESSYICLVSNDKKEMLEVSKKGTYKIADLQKNKQSIESNYAMFTTEELLEIGNAKYDSMKFRHRNRTGITPNRNLVIAMLPLERCRIYGNKITIKWLPLSNGIAFKEDVNQYKVLILNLNDIVLFEEKTSQMQLMIDLSKKKELIEEILLILKIVPLDKSGKELQYSVTIDGDAIVKLDEAEKQKITQELNVIFKDQSRETAFTKLVEARFFEDKELYIDAINAYEEAVKLSFGAEIYQKAYRYFLLRNGLSY